MDLGNKTETIKARFPVVNTLVFILSILFMLVGLLTTLLDQVTFLGIKIMYVIPFLSAGVGYVSFKGILSYREGSHIDLFEEGLKFEGFESKYDKLVIRRNSVTETMTFDNGVEKADFTGSISKEDYLKIMSL